MKQYLVTKRKGETVIVQAHDVSFIRNSMLGPIEYIHFKNESGELVAHFKEADVKSIVIVGEK